jgi:hypothetical protein
MLIEQNYNTEYQATAQIGEVKSKQNGLRYEENIVMKCRLIIRRTGR